MSDAVILSYARTAIGDAFKGSLASTSIYDLGRAAVTEALKRSGVDADEVDDIILGEVLQGGGDIARYIAVELGLTDIPGMAVMRACASGLQAVCSAAASIKAGMDRAIIAGGVESMSSAPSSFKRGADGELVPWMSDSHPATEDAPNRNMGVTVGENTAAAAGVSRREQDEWALASHQRAVAAIDAGRLAEEIIPVEVSDGAGGRRIFDTDEHPRRDTTLAKLAALPARFKEGGTVTAGNASSLNDGAAALVVASAGLARSSGLAPLAVLRGWASVGVPPGDTGLAPTLAIPKAVARAGISLSDIKLVEINEAFAAMAVASSRSLGFPHEIVNVNGGAVGLGHPVGASGARVLGTLMMELRRRGGGYGVASLCAGGGMATAAVVEVPAA
ncbi:MAG TPA: thiolase family protein [Acidimicrobiales bacterium]|nr:thiolase family protein [Acidimicrobiales bacterium]